MSAKRKSYGEVARAAWLDDVVGIDSTTLWNRVARAVISAFKARQKAKQPQPRAKSGRKEKT